MIMTRNYIVDTVQIISDSTLYVSGKNVYNYSQLMFEIERFLKARYDSNITVTRSSGNRLLITNPLSSNLNIDHLSIDAGFTTLFRGAIAIGHSGVTTSVRFRNLRPASSTGFLRSLLNSNKFGGTASFPDSTNGLEVGDVISINGQIGVASIQTVNSTCTRNTTIQDLLNLIRTAFNLPLYDGTPQNNLSVSIISNTLIMPGSGGNIIAGSIVIRGRLGQANSISNVSINISNSDSDNVDPNYVFLSNLSFTEIQAARN